MITEKNWLATRQWAFYVSGLALIAMAIYTPLDPIALFLRLWTGFFGILCIYLGLKKSLFK